MILFSILMFLFSLADSDAKRRETSSGSLNSPIHNDVIDALLYESKDDEWVKEDESYSSDYVHQEVEIDSGHQPGQPESGSLWLKRSRRSVKHPGGSVPNHWQPPIKYTPKKASQAAHLPIGIKDDSSELKLKSTNIDLLKDSLARQREEMKERDQETKLYRKEVLRTLMKITYRQNLLQEKLDSLVPLGAGNNSFVFLTNVVQTKTLNTTQRNEVALITKDYEELGEKVEMRYFQRREDNYTGMTDSQIWESGQIIGCSVTNGGDTVNLDFPAAVPSKQFMKLNVFTHGFRDTVKEGKAKFVPAYFDAAQGWNNDIGDKGVILIDWSPLAALQQVGPDGSGYDLAAKNAIDVGNYVGHCLAEIKQNMNIYFQNSESLSFNLAGHNLGAHSMGKAGRVFNVRAGEMVDSIFGLDPAGPRFVNGLDSFGADRLAVTVLNQNILRAGSASRVITIHTNGGLKPSLDTLAPELGILQATGDFNFYVDGGRLQPGCPLPDITFCAHSRVVLYYYHSLKIPMLLPSQECPSLSECIEQNPTPGSVAPQVYWTDSMIVDSPASPRLYFTPVEFNYWDFDEFKTCPENFITGEAQDC